VAGGVTRGTSLVVAVAAQAGQGEMVIAKPHVGQVYRRTTLNSISDMASP
jgi:hypothetical protein